ncbi:MAG TPA: hypothetical protein VGQ20_00590 [Acidimicrobiales bacterium]|nr:hypothetical protein [Acidimicrobiales bacterium]
MANVLAEEERIKEWVAQTSRCGEGRGPARTARGGGAAPDAGAFRGAAVWGGPAFDDGAGG